MQQAVSLGLPLYDFPTTLIFVDDDKAFIDVLCTRLRSDLIKTFGVEGYFDFKIFYNAIEAFELLKNLSLQNLVGDLNGWKRVESTAGEGAVQVDFSSIRQLMYDEKRYQLITTVILDEYMPELSGAHLCARIKGKSAEENLNTSYPVLLLTGNADYEFGMATVMDNGADGFIHKGDDQHIRKLKDMILACKKKVLLEQSIQLLENIFTVTRHNTLLRDSVFVEFFKKIRTSNKAAEYVVLDAYGSTFFQTLEGEKSILVVQHESQLQDLHSRLECYDHPEKISDIAQAIYSRKKIPFFFTEEEAELPLEKWGLYLHSATPMEGLAGYYYAYITDLSAYDIQAEKISHYKKVNKSFLDVYPII
jgi:CheY-like chemotaxis protein